MAEGVGDRKGDGKEAREAESLWVHGAGFAWSWERGGAGAQGEVLRGRRGRVCWRG